MEAVCFSTTPCSFYHITLDFLIRSRTLSLSTSPCKWENIKWSTVTKMTTIYVVLETSVMRAFQPTVFNNWSYNTGLFKITVGVLTTCHAQYTSDRGICIFLFNRTTFQVIATYLTGALYVHPLWFYKHQHDNRVRSKLFLACQRWWFHWRFWFVSSVPGNLREEEEHKPDPWRNPIGRNHMGLHLENEVARRVTSY